VHFLKVWNRETAMRGVKGKVLVLVVVWVGFGTVAAEGYQAKERVSCTVNVVDIKGRPVAGAEVAAFEDLFYYSEGRIQAELLDGIKKTDSNGTVVLNLNVAIKGNTYIVARKKGLALGCERLDPYNVEPVANIVLDEPVRLGGTVVDETGRGVRGARVLAILGELEKWGLREPKEWLTTETDTKGRFVFDNIPIDARAEFFVESPGLASFYTFMASDRHGHRFAAGENDIRIVLPAEAKIEGYVVDDSGKPVAGVKLVARPNKGGGGYNASEPAVSGKDGRFYFRGLAADTYFVQVVSPREGMADWVGKVVKVVVKEGQTAKRVKVRVNKGGLVDVVVQDAATKKPLDNVEVGVFQKGPGLSCCFTQHISTGSNGVASFRAPVGRSFIEGVGDGYCIFKGIKSNVTKGKRIRVTVLLERYAIVTGTVRDESGRPATVPFCTGYAAESDGGG
jgi:protocatechuate 3,4-dioxygenase beta subunit